MKKYSLIIFIIILIFFIRISVDFSLFIEEYYSQTLYVFISKTLRLSLGWIPFSVGDFLYMALFGWIGYSVFNFLKERKKFKVPVFYNSILFLCSIYVVFYLFWGLNYNRVTISQKLKINNQYTQDELLVFTKNLIQKINTIHLKITNDKNKIVVNPYTHQQIFNQTTKGYIILAQQFDFLAFEQPSIKTSIISYPLSYMGFSGYLNPFTNEAHVNYLVPLYHFPTTSCHEMAHQIGIGSESEANLIGHLASVKNPDIYFQYSGYTYALRYCLGEIYDMDEALFEEFKSTINPGVLKNFEQTEQFLTAHESPIETVTKFIYGSYLEANHQKGGMKTYNNFVGLVINYYKNYDKSTQLF